MSSQSFGRSSVALRITRCSGETIGIVAPAKGTRRTAAGIASCSASWAKKRWTGGPSSSSPASAASTSGRARPTKTLTSMSDRTRLGVVAERDAPREAHLLVLGEFALVMLQVDPQRSKGVLDRRQTFRRDEDVDVDVDRRPRLAVIGKADRAADRVLDLGVGQRPVDRQDLLREPMRCVSLGPHRGPNPRRGIALHELTVP